MGTQRCRAQAASHFSHESSAHWCTVTQLDQTLGEFSPRPWMVTTALGKGQGDGKNPQEKRKKAFPASPQAWWGLQPQCSHARVGNRATSWSCLRQDGHLLPCSRGPVLSGRTGGSTCGTPKPWATQGMPAHSKVAGRLRKKRKIRDPRSRALRHHSLLIYISAASLNPKTDESFFYLGDWPSHLNGNMDIHKKKWSAWQQLTAARQRSPVFLESVPSSHVKEPHFLLLTCSLISFRF